MHGFGYLIPGVCACACVRVRVRVCVCVAQFYLVAYEHPQAEATILGIEADDVGARHAITRKGSINNNGSVMITSSTHLQL